MKSRHQFKRRFSLQPSFLKDDTAEDNQKGLPRSQRTDPEGEGVAAAAGEGPRTPPGAAPPSSAPAAAVTARHRVVVMGAARVGKSSLIARFLYGTFPTKYKRTVEEMHHGRFAVAGATLALDILDTSGAYEFPAMRALSMAHADAFVLVYDVTDEATFEEARALRDQIREARPDAEQPVPIVVVGNKTDLAGDRQVDTATTESVVTVDWENGFVETSAKEDVNVLQVFKELMVQAKLQYRLSPAPRRRGRRQSLPPPAAGSAHSAVPSAAQLHHLQQIRDRHGKRNSCILS